MLTFNEYRQVKFLVTEMCIEEQVARYLINENFLTDFAQKTAKKYLLPVTVVMALISGQGCKDNSCPTPQVQEKIKQDLDNELQNRKVITSDDGKKFITSDEKQTELKKKFITPDDDNKLRKFITPDEEQTELKKKFLVPDEERTKPVEGRQVAPDIIQISQNTYRVKGFGKTSKIGGPAYASRMALSDAQKKLMKYLKLSSVNFYHTTVVDSQKTSGGFIKTYEMSVK